MAVYGTRPEAVKLAPIIRQFDADARFALTVAVTGQHRSMLDQINAGFGIRPDVDLDVFEAGQSLCTLASKTLIRLESAIKAHQPEAILVQGDTSSAFAAALAGFYTQTPVVHVEAGLRTLSIESPYPEEGNRRLITRVSALHLAPTEANKQNLLDEGVPASDVTITGNPVIDALRIAVATPSTFTDPQVERAAMSGSVVLITAHRRESWGRPMHDIAEAVHALCLSYPDVHFVFPLHHNPAVRAIFQEHLSEVENCVLTEPLDYFELASLLAACKLVITDSGGIQEEAPALGVPVVVLRNETERAEGVEAGTAVLVGTDRAAIINTVSELLSDSARHAAMANAINPYGDGKAADRTVAATAQLLGVGERLPDFSVKEMP
ncbi:MAG TPA: UDP-N-acetylglucosamine 2-epimerase (non-hydrolyzing) [Propionibacteriaceae bacterium]|nr:UDP-N-acetylglucosamine 2-epimerase (non-hydrolyzing) [Propionibacteriaceae bacterium]